MPVRAKTCRTLATGVLGGALLIAALLLAGCRSATPNAPAGPSVPARAVSSAIPATVLVSTLAPTAASETGAVEATAAATASAEAPAVPASAGLTPTGLPLPATPITPGVSAPPVYAVKGVRSYPHDAAAFTEGLAWDGATGELYEGTGLYGQSTLRRVDLQTGRVLQRLALSDTIFGEGIAIVGARLAELTWTGHIGYVYDKASFARQDEFGYTGEGWGLAFDGRRLVMSDGTAVLRFLDPATYTETSRITVTSAGVPVIRLNELEYVEGRLYANVWLTDRIAVIEPETGRVTAWLDCAGLRPQSTLNNTDAVLNGIAYDPAARRLFVTGKLWPVLYEIQPVAPS